MSIHEDKSEEIIKLVEKEAEFFEENYLQLRKDIDAHFIEWHDENCEGSTDECRKWFLDLMRMSLRDLLAIRVEEKQSKAHMRHMFKSN